MVSPSKPPVRADQVGQTDIYGVNNGADQLSQSMTKMSLSRTALPDLPPSSSGGAGAEVKDHKDLVSATPIRSAQHPLQRAPSTSSPASNDIASAPSLQKRTSTTSLKGAAAATPPRSPALRRSSSYFHNLSMGDRSSLPAPVEEVPPKPPATAASVAHDFFVQELQARHSSNRFAPAAEAVVILQDACYGHRYSRPRTSKANLGTIVERPERIHAAILGVATAYVRLGGRHAEGEAAPHPEKDSTTTPAPPFKIHKTPRTLSLKSSAATAVHGVKWMDELSRMCDSAESKLAINGKELERSQSPILANGGTSTEKPKFHEGDLYLCSRSLAALEGALGGVCEGVDAVFADTAQKRAFVCIRPPGHHCAADMPSGFCWLNNVHVGIGHASITHGLTHAAIIDFDLHHGDGSQSITWDHNTRIANMPKNTPVSKKTSIGYFSLHDINSYPCEMGDEDKVRNASLCIENAHGQSIWNVHLQPWKTVSEFWTLYEDRYLVVLAKARAFLRAHTERLRQAPTHPKAKGAIFISAGFDASEWESPGMQRHQVNVPTEFYARFTRDIVTMAKEEALGVEGRVISVLEGGYSDRALMSGILSHISGLMMPPAAGQSRPSTSSSTSGQVQSAVESFNGDTTRITSNAPKQPSQTYDPAWWSLQNLEELENILDPSAPSAVPKGQRGKVQPTFTTPTESFIAKVVEPAKGRRSTSGSVVTYPVSPTSKRAPSPPPPEVGWATAAHELSSLLIPSDQETRSCRPEDLNAEATRKRRDRASNIGLPTDEPTMAVEPKTMQLREKKTKAPASMVTQEQARKPVSRASRRKTVADVTLLDPEGESLPSTEGQGEPSVSRTARRRSSVASSTASISTATAGEPPTFSLPSGTQSQRDTLGAKKPRPLTGPVGAGAVKPKAVRRPVTAPRLPSANSVTAKQAALAASSSNAGRAPLPTNDDAKQGDVDELASRMKNISIKLNVPPKAEYEARMSKAKASSKGRVPKIASAKTTNIKSPTKPKGESLTELASTASVNGKADLPAHVTAAGSGPSAPAMKEIPSLPVSKEEGPRPNTMFPAEPPRLPTPTMEHDRAILHSQAPAEGVHQMPLPVGADTVPAGARDRAAPASIPLPASSPPSSAQTGTPITARRNTKEDLPVFTATSPISFGRPKTYGIDQTLHDDGRSSLQKASEPTSAFATPRGNDAYARAPLNTDQSQQETPQPPHPSLPAADANRLPTVKNGEQPEMSIWDIPDTPPPRTQS